MAEARSDDTAWSRKKRNARLLIFFAILCVVTIGHVLSNIISSSRLLDDERVSQEETLKYQSEPLPSNEDVLSYLDGKDVVPTDSKGVSVAGSTPLTLKKQSIEGLTIKHDDPVYILATFTFKSDRGPYAIEILINYGPSDGRYGLGSFRTRKASKQ